VKVDILIIGAGIIGLTVARSLALNFKNKKILIIDKEKSIAYHTSSRNSGVIHSAFHLKPGTLKAKLCLEGNRLLTEYCIKNNIPILRTGKFVLALNDLECKKLRLYKKWGELNGEKVEILEFEEFRKYEPYAKCMEALYSPSASVINPRLLCLKIFEELQRLNVKFLFNTSFKDVKKSKNLIITTSSHIIEANYVINCAGLYADKIARRFGFCKDYFIVPFKGEYLKLKREYSYIVNSMLYRVPFHNFPFLGIHFTKRINGDVIIGPNATLSIGRENYDFIDINIFEFFETLFKVNFIKMILNKDFLSFALKEFKKTLSLDYFLRDIKDIVPVINKSMVKRSISGIRAQLVDSKGNLINDFIIEHDSHSMHILNAVSPALTSSFSFANYIRKIIEENYYI